MNFGVGIWLNNSSGNARWFTSIGRPRAAAAACSVCSASVAHGQPMSDHTVTVRGSASVISVSMMSCVIALPVLSEPITICDVMRLR